MLPSGALGKDNDIGVYLVDGQKLHEQDNQ
jgi:hypothetical protein